jgi:hypothetical protein
MTGAYSLRQFYLYLAVKYPPWSIESLTNEKRVCPYKSKFDSSFLSGLNVSLLKKCNLHVNTIYIKTD